MTGSFTIQSHSDGSVQYDGFALSVTCQTVTCPFIGNVHADAVTSGSAFLSWSVLGVSDTTTYDNLYLTYTNLSDSTSVTVTPTATDHMVLTGLDSNTTYSVGVFTVCSGFSTDTVFTTFTTKVLPCIVVDSVNSHNDTVGSGSATSSRLPSSAIYNYSLTEQIFLPDEIGGSGDIRALAVNATSILTARGNYKIYLGTTSQSTMSSMFTTNNLQLIYNEPSQMNADTTD